MLTQVPTWAGFGSEYRKYLIGCRFFSNILFSGNMRQTGTRKAREKKYFMSVEGGKKEVRRKWEKPLGDKKKKK